MVCKYLRTQKAVCFNRDALSEYCNIRRNFNLKCSIYFNARLRFALGVAVGCAHVAGRGHLSGCDSMRFNLRVYTKRQISFAFA